MIAITLELLFKGIGYSMVIYAFWLLVGNSFYHSFVKTGVRKYQAQRRIKRLRELEKEEVREVKSKSAITKHLEMLLSSVSSKDNVNVSNLVMLTLILLFVTTLLLFLLINDIFFSLVIGIIVALSPYLLIIYRLEVLRLKTSHAFMNEYHVILQNYQSSQQNVYYTLLNTVEDLDDKNMKRQFRKLISSFQKERHDSDFKKHVHVFIYSINSTFAKRFGNLLIKAHLENADIGESLVTLNQDITQRKKNMEDEHTEKLQTIMMGFAPIVVLPITVWFAYQITGVINFWYFFKQPTSLALFIICLVGSIVSVLLAFIIRKPKADI